MTSENPVIYHNPSCSKSRETLQILQQNSSATTIIEYLSQPPTEHDLRNIISLLDISVRELLRDTEPEFKLTGADDRGLNDDEIIAIICEHPVLLQRPIVVANGRAVIARPPTKVLEIIA